VREGKEATYAALRHVGRDLLGGHKSSAGEGEHGGNGGLHDESRYRQMVEKVRCGVVKSVLQRRKW
jgi:hypothetical protein